MINQVLMIVMAAGAALGGVDRLLGNKFGLGEQFERGFTLLGPLALSMAGMVCLAPVLADALGRVVVPFYRLSANWGGIIMDGQINNNQLTAFERHPRLEEREPGTIEKHPRDVRSFAARLGTRPLDKETAITK